MSDHVRMTRAERRSQTRERLMASAVEVFAERGITGAPVEEICERAGYSRGAFYSNFASKDDLCLAIVTANMQAHVGGITDSVGERGADSEVDPVEAVLNSFVARTPLGSEQAIFSQELDLYAQREPGFRPAYRAWLEQCYSQIGEILTTAAAGTGLRLIIPIETATHLLWASFAETLTQAAVFEDADDGRDRLRRALLTVVRLITEPDADDSGAPKS